VTQRRRSSQTVSAASCVILRWRCAVLFFPPTSAHSSSSQIEPTKSPLHSHGSHHVLYRLDGKIIAIAVLDLLPNAVSSVYFIWDPDYAGLSLGKLSALREAQMVREMQKDGAWGEGAEGRYMMGSFLLSLLLE
jgi:hypothetical protein